MSRVDQWERAAMQPVIVLQPPASTAELVRRSRPLPFALPTADELDISVGPTYEDRSAEVLSLKKQADGLLDTFGVDVTIGDTAYEVTAQSYRYADPDDPTQTCQVRLGRPVDPENPRDDVPGFIFSRPEEDMEWLLGQAMPILTPIEDQDRQLGFWNHGSGTYLVSLPTDRHRHATADDSSDMVLAETIVVGLQTQATETSAALQQADERSAALLADSEEATIRDEVVAERLARRQRQEQRRVRLLSAKRHLIQLETAARIALASPGSGELEDRASVATSEQHEVPEASRLRARLDNFLDNITEDQRVLLHGLTSAVVLGGMVAALAAVGDSVNSDTSGKANIIKSVQLQPTMYCEATIKTSDGTTAQVCVKSSGDLQALLGKDATCAPSIMNASHFIIDRSVMDTITINLGNTVDSVPGMPELNPQQEADALLCVKATEYAKAHPAAHDFKVSISVPNAGTYTDEVKR